MRRYPISLYKPKMFQGTEIIGGRVPKEEELVDLDKYLTPEEIAKKGESLPENESIPDYWLKVFKNNEILGTFYFLMMFKMMQVRN